MPIALAVSLPVLRDGKTWKPARILEMPPANIMLDNVDYLSEQDPFLMSRDAAFLDGGEIQRQHVARRSADTLPACAGQWSAEVGSLPRQASRSEVTGLLGRVEVHEPCIR